MDPMKPSVMITQVQDLPAMMREHTRLFDRGIRNVLTPLEFLSLARVFLVGDGDSFHGSMAAEMAFESIAKIVCEPISAMRFLEYGAPYIPANFPNDTLVVGISASGRTQRVIQALRRANAVSPKIITAALTGTPESELTKNANRIITVDVPSLGGSPGIRTYSATLMGLFLLAIRIGELRNLYHQTEANAMRQELASLGDVVEATIRATEQPACAAALALKDAATMIFVGSGPSLGTAMFSAAKVVEAAGVFAVGQDLEEWAHVERFAYPDDIPTFIIAPPGRGYWRAVELARAAKGLGRRLVAVVREGDTEIAPLADFVLPVAGDVREEFSPLVYHIAADLFASHLAENLGRMLFQTDRPAMMEQMAAAQRPTTTH